MNIDNLLVEVRDVNLERKGAIPADDLNLTFKDYPRGIGEWKLQLPAEHGMVRHLRQPGSGIIVTDLDNPDNPIMSGPTDQESFVSDPEDPVGTLTINGYSDSVMLWDPVCYPNPTLNLADQDRTNDVRVGRADTLMRYFVSFNLGETALSVRRAPLAAKVRGNYSTSAANPVGPSTPFSASPRFDQLGDVLYTLALNANLNFRLVQIGSLIQFQITNIRDRTDTVRMDVANGTLASQEVQTAAPKATQAIVAGQGQGTERTVLVYDTPASRAASQDWGRWIEVFKDQRNTDDATELQQAGVEALADISVMATAVKAVPANDQTMIYPRDWAAGDLVTVVIDGQEVSSTVTEVAGVADENGLAIGAAVGNVTGFDPKGALNATVEDNTKRIDTLEKHLDSPTYYPSQVPVFSESHPASDMPSMFSTGITVGSTASADGYPVTLGVVTTTKVSDFRCYQEVIPKGDATFARYTRSSIDSSTWSAWRNESGGTGWINSGFFVPSTGVTFAQNARIRRDGDTVSVFFQQAVVDSLSISTFGDIGNRALCVVDEQFRPIQDGQPLSSGQTGRIGSFYINSSGGIYLAAVVPLSTATGTYTETNVAVSFGGTYLVN